jgi:Zn-dependent protease
MRVWSLPIGRVFGVEVRLHFTFLILPFFIYWTDANAHSGNASASRDFALSAVILSAVLVHEWGHAYVARRLRLVPRAVILLPLGGVTVYDDLQAKRTATGVSLWQRELRLALAGPLVNLICAAIAVLVLRLISSDVSLWSWPFLQSSNLPRSLVWANLYLAGLNLLPAYPLDGGRILRALFARDSDLSTATRRAVSISSALAMVLMLAGVFTDTWLTMIGVIVFFAAQLEERSHAFQSVLENVVLEEIMLTDFTTLSPADTLEGALDKAVHSLQDDFPVVRGNDMVGVISRQRILESLREEGNGYVQRVMIKLSEASGRKETLGSAFRKLTTRRLNMIPVVEDQRLVGIVTLQNLMHSMSLLAESRRFRREQSGS